MVELHGENGVTYSFFTELEENKKVKEFLEMLNFKKFENIKEGGIKVHLFPSFGRRDGPGEPDALVTTDSFSVYIEVKIGLDDEGSNLKEHVRLFDSLGKRLAELKEPVTYPVKCSCSAKKGGEWRFGGRQITRKLVENELIGKDYCVCCLTPDPSLPWLGKFDKCCHVNIVDAIKKLGLKKTEEIYRRNIEK